MKKILGLISALLISSAVLADDTYTWNPTDLSGDDNTSLMGGNGTMNRDLYSWWINDGVGTNVQAGNATDGGANQRFGNFTGTPGNAILNFHQQATGTTNITWQYNLAFDGSSTGTRHTLNFDGGGTFNFSASASNAVIGITSSSFGGAFTLNIAAGTAVTDTNLGSTNNDYHTWITNWAAPGNDRAQGFTVAGGGSFTLNNHTAILQRNKSSRLNVQDGSTLTFNTGSTLLPVGGDANPANSTLSTILATNTLNIDLTRIAVTKGTLNVSGGTVISGTNVGNGDSRYGLLLNAAAGNTATVNLSSGTLVAIGDLYYLSSLSNTKGGIHFDGAGSNNFVMTGGELITTGFIAYTPTAATAGNITFDGGTVIVSTHIGKGTASGTISTANYTARLDNFIAGFNNMNRKVQLGEGGLNIDTSNIDLTATGGNNTVTIDSILHNKVGANGTLTKLGANTLRLTRVNTYTGNTTVSAGKLVNDGTIAGDTYVADGALLGGNGTFRNITFEGASATFDTTTGFTAADLHFATNLTINLDLSTVTDSLAALITLGNITATGSTLTLNLTGTSTSDLGGYSLLSAASIDSGITVNVTGDLNNLSFSVANGQVVLGIPEPSTYALIAALGILTLALSRRRK